MQAFAYTCKRLHALWGVNRMPQVMKTLKAMVSVQGPGVRRPAFRSKLSVCLVVLVLVPIASADIVVNFVSVAPAVSFPPNYFWSYSAVISAGDGLCGNTSFTLNHVGGTIVTIEPPHNWSGSQIAGGGLQFTWTGACTQLSTTTTFDSFNFVDSLGTGVNSTYSSQDLTQYPNGTVQSGSGTIEVPGVPSSPVPEPGSILLLGVGLLTAAATMKVRGLEKSNLTSRT